MDTNTTRAPRGATNRRAFLAGAAAIGAAGTVTIAATATAFAGEASPMAGLIDRHREAYRLWRTADALHESVEKTIREELDSAILVLPTRGQTFSIVRQFGADHYLAQIQDPRNHPSARILQPGEADRIRRFESQIRTVEEDNSWSAICAAHEHYDDAEGVAWEAVLQARPATLAEAAERMAYVLEHRPSEELMSFEVEMLAKSFLDA